MVLPAELGLEIYLHLGVTEDGVIKVRYDKRNHRAPTTAFAGVSKLVGDEVLCLYYSQNQFKFDSHKENNLYLWLKKSPDCHSIEHTLHIFRTVAQTQVHEAFTSAVVAKYLSVHPARSASRFLNSNVSARQDDYEQQS